MNTLSDVGQLLYLYLEEIIPDESFECPSFVVEAGAQLLQNDAQRNWVPLIVKQTGPKQYQAIANSLVYAIAESAGLERVWCILADDQETSEEISRVLCGEQIPKINLSTASYDEIYAAFQYLLKMDETPLKSLKSQLVVPRIDEAPRRYWKDFNPITQLKCGITKGKKLDALKTVFYLKPEPLPEIITDVALLNSMTSTELKKMAKKRGIIGYTKLKKNELVEQLSKT